MNLRLPLVVLVGAVVLHADPGRAQTAALEELSAFPQTTLSIKSGSTTNQFTVWIADSAAREEQGLMFVRELAADKGMVFVGEQPKVWSMWMRNTYVPLDMLFIAVDGHILKIAHAIPHDETTISSDVVVNGVIELQGGISEKLHIKVGDIARWQAPH